MKKSLYTTSSKRNLRPKLKGPITRQKKVKVGDAGYKGLGLFANKTFKKGECILEVVTKKMSHSNWQKRSAALGVPESSGLWWYDKRAYDPLFDSMSSAPVWWRLNHSYFPNCDMVPHSSSVEWKANQTIHIGQEICFHYKDPDDEWDRTM